MGGDQGGIRFGMESLFSVPKSAVHRERDGESSTKPHHRYAFGFVAAARF